VTSTTTYAFFLSFALRGSDATIFLVRYFLSIHSKRMAGVSRPFRDHANAGQMALACNVRELGNFIERSVISPGPCCSPRSPNKSRRRVSRKDDSNLEIAERNTFFASRVRNDRGANGAAERWLETNDAELHVEKLGIQGEITFSPATKSPSRHSVILRTSDLRFDPLPIKSWAKQWIHLCASGHVCRSALLMSSGRKDGSSNAKNHVEESEGLETIAQGKSGARGKSDRRHALTPSLGRSGARPCAV
jgi:hypothetical protein